MALYRHIGIDLAMVPFLSKRRPFFYAECLKTVFLVQAASSIAVDSITPPHSVVCFVRRIRKSCFLAKKKNQVMRHRPVDPVILFLFEAVAFYCKCGPRFERKLALYAVALVPRNAGDKCDAKAA